MFLCNKCHNFDRCDAQSAKYNAICEKCRKPTTCVDCRFALCNVVLYHTEMKLSEAVTIVTTLAEDGMILGAGKDPRDDPAYDSIRSKQQQAINMVRKHFKK